MAARIGRRTSTQDGDDKRRCTITLTADMDLRLSVYAKKHRLTRSQAAAQAIAALVRGMKLAFGDASMREDGEAA